MSTHMHTDTTPPHTNKQGWPLLLIDYIGSEIQNVNLLDFAIIAYLSLVWKSGFSSTIPLVFTHSLCWVRLLLDRQCTHPCLLPSEKELTTVQTNDYTKFQRDGPVSSLVKGCLQRPGRPKFSCVNEKPAPTQGVTHKSYNLRASSERLGRSRKLF